MSHGELQAEVTPELLMLTFKTWRGIKHRCTPSGAYTKIGISLHAPWRNSFEAFVRDAGYRPSHKHSIDRIDGNRGYEPGNVRWVLPDVQQANRIDQTWIEFRGERRLLSEVAREHEISPGRVAERLRRGWTIREALGIDGRSRAPREPGAPTERQEDLLRFIDDFTRAHGHPPSLREMCATMKIGSTNGVSAHLHALRKKGCVTWDPGRSRTLRIVRSA